MSLVIRDILNDGTNPNQLTEPCLFAEHDRCKSRSSGNDVGCQCRCHRASRFKVGSKVRPEDLYGTHPGRIGISVQFPSVHPAMDIQRLDRDQTDITLGHFEIEVINDVTNEPVGVIVWCLAKDRMRYLQNLDPQDALLTVFGSQSFGPYFGVFEFIWLSLNQ